MPLIIHTYKGYAPGFCYIIHQLTGYYLVSKKYNLDFYFHDDGFMYRHTQGWHDYFDSLNIYDPSKNYEGAIHLDLTVEERQIAMFNIFKQDNYFTLRENRDAICQITKLNKIMQIKLETAIIELQLEIGNFDSIFIRRGDKMFSESTYIDTELYVDKLVEKGTSTIYVQTDDYLAFLEVQEIIKTKYLNRIRVCTLCPETKRGTVTSLGYKNLIITNQIIITDRVTEKNIDYIENFKKNCIKSVEEYTPEEMKIHTEEMIIGLELCSLSRFLAMDIQSNVSRYLYMKHSNIDNIISIDDFFRPKLDTIIMNGCKEFDLRRF